MPLVHVELPGHGTFWVWPEVFRGGESPLIPEDHVRDGELVSLRGDLAYAHVYAQPGEECISRRGEVIGLPSDLRRVAGAGVPAIHSLVSDPVPLRRFRAVSESDNPGGEVREIHVLPESVRGSLYEQFSDAVLSRVEEAWGLRSLRLFRAVSESDSDG